MPYYHAMQISGRRFCIAGSANESVDSTLLEYAHRLVIEIVRALVAEGGVLLCGVGKNPLQKASTNSLSLIFDWTIMEYVAAEFTAGRLEVEKPQGRMLASVLTYKTNSQIPPDKAATWETLIGANATTIQHIEPGWASGAVRRQHQARLADVLIAIGGGEGVEHLAKEFVSQGKPVIPLDLNLGASKGDGSGGAHRLFNEMRHRPEAFIKAYRPDRLGTVFARMETVAGSKEISQVVDAIIDLIRELCPPEAFYVRLLNPKIAGFDSVERYFRHVVDPVVAAFGYHAIEMGRSESTSPWMNVQIFEKIHFSGVTIVDLTGARPNCLMELGYAFGRERRVIITAEEGTVIPFDASPIEVRSWSDSTDDLKRIEELQDYWRRNINRPSLVRA